MKHFNQLTYQGQRRRLYRLASDVLKRYNMQVDSLRMLQYEDNAVFRVNSRTGEAFILRISSGEGYNLSEQQSEVHWLLALNRDTRLIVPQPIPSIAGEYVLTIDHELVAEPRLCALFRFIPGKIPEGHLSPIELERFGEMTALLHEHSAHYQPTEKIIRPVWGWDRLFGESSFLNTKYRSRLSSDEIERFEKVGKIIETRLKDLNSSDYGLIHADLHRGNLIIQKDQLGIIDFDDCGWGYYLFDVATLLSSIYRLSEDEREYRILKDAYLIGYDRIRALPSTIDQELLPFFVMRDMVIVNFILRSENQEVWSWGGDRVKGIIREMRNFIESGRYIGV